MYLTKRNGTFYLCYLSELGIERRVSTRCKTKRDALIFVQSFREKEHERSLALKRKLFSDFSDDFLVYSKSVHTPNTTESCGAALREFERIVGNLPLQSIGVREIEKFLATKKEKTSEWTARRCYVTLAAAFEKAKKWDLVLENPFRKVEKPKVREIAPCYFSLKEFQQFLTFIEERDFKELCITAFTTGMRLSEISALKWTDIDLTRRTILVQNSATFTTKSKRNRVIPISNTLFEVLFARKERMSSESELVFHRQGKRLSK